MLDWFLPPINELAIIQIIPYKARSAQEDYVITIFSKKEYLIAFKGKIREKRTFRKRSDFQWVYTFLLYPPVKPVLIKSMVHFHV